MLHRNSSQEIIENSLLKSPYLQSVSFQPLYKIVRFLFRAGFRIGPGPLYTSSEDIYETAASKIRIVKDRLNDNYSYDRSIGT